MRRLKSIFAIVFVLLVGLATESALAQQPRPRPHPWAQRQAAKRAQRQAAKANAKAKANKPAETEKTGENPSAHSGAEPGKENPKGAVPGGEKAIGPNGKGDGRGLAGLPSLAEVFAVR